MLRTSFTHDQMFKGSTPIGSVLSSEGENVELWQQAAVLTLFKLGLELLKRICLGTRMTYKQRLWMIF